MPDSPRHIKPALRNGRQFAAPILLRWILAESAIGSMAPPKHDAVVDHEDSGECEKTGTTPALIRGWSTRCETRRGPGLGVDREC